MRFQLTAAAKSARDPYHAISDVIAKLTEILGQLDIPLPPRDEVQKMAEDLYDNIIAPMDIPVIGPIIEARVDAMLRSVFVQQVMHVYDYFQRNRGNSQALAA